MYAALWNFTYIEAITFTPLELYKTGLWISIWQLPRFTYNVRKFLVTVPAERVTGGSQRVASTPVSFAVTLGHCEILGWLKPGQIVIFSPSLSLCWREDCHLAIAENHVPVNVQVPDHLVPRWFLVENCVPHILVLCNDAKLLFYFWFEWGCHSVTRQIMASKWLPHSPAHVHFVTPSRLPYFFFNS